jgi:hypothetical protein
MRLFAIAAIAGFISVPLVAAETSLPPAAAAGEAQKKICRRLENNTGSHLSATGRVCKTADQWAKYDNAENLRNTGSKVDRQAKDDE